MLQRHGITQHAYDTFQEGWKLKYKENRDRTGGWKEMRRLDFDLHCMYCIIDKS